MGPAIAVFWGWLPALLWVVLGAVFIGAVHDLGTLVVSLRNRGYTIGEIAGRMISPRARLLFLFILFFSLTTVLAIFGLVIAVIFSVYPQTVLPVWIAMPLAVVIGFFIRRATIRGVVWISLVSLALLCLAVYLGAEYLPITLGNLPLFAGKDANFWAGLQSAIVVWTFVLLIYCFVASVLPVWMLLQPRDYINSHLLFLGLALLFAGLVVARPEFVAPVVNDTPPADAPPIFPFLFITIACGAVSGFHCLVSSGTSSKQLAKEPDAQFVGYGAMLLEGVLAVLVILACSAGLGLGTYETSGGILRPVVDTQGEPIRGLAAWKQYYGVQWNHMQLVESVGAFVDGGANMVVALGFPLNMAAAFLAVMVACFAVTTLDTATRIQRYVIEEIGRTLHLPGLSNKYVATTVAVATAGALALLPGPTGPGSGGQLLWPLFGATNQLLAGLAFLVVAFYMIRHNRPTWFLIPPLVIMVAMPAVAMGMEMQDWYKAGNWLLFSIAVAIGGMQAWMVLEAVFMWNRAKGVLPIPLPPVERPSLATRNPHQGRC